MFVPNVVASHRPNAGWVALNIDRISANGWNCSTTVPLTMRCRLWNFADGVDLWVKVGCLATDIYRIRFLSYRLCYKSWAYLTLN